MILNLHRGTALFLVVDRSTHRVYLLRFGQFGQTVTGDTEKGKDQVMRSCTCSLPGREDVTVTRATAALGNRQTLSVSSISRTCQPLSKGLYLGHRSIVSDTSASRIGAIIPLEGVYISILGGPANGALVGGACLIRFPAPCEFKARWKCGRELEKNSVCVT